MSHILIENRTISRNPNAQVNLRRTNDSCFTRQDFYHFSKHEANILDKTKSVFHMKRVPQNYKKKHS